MPFRNLVGHHRIASLLARAIGRDALPPSLLFGGPEGIGKRSTALATAQTLNCLTPVRGAALPIDGCGQCAACRRIERGIHPDVLTITPGDSGSIKVDAIRDAIESAAYRPFEGRRRVVIVDDAETMVPHAQNALLKTLEEPRPASVFILVSAQPDLLLPTVRSRCSHIRFGRLSVDDLVKLLVERCEYNEAEARTVAPVADGSLRRALDARGTDLAAARQSAHEWLARSAASGDLRGRLEFAKTLFPEREWHRENLSAVLRVLSSLLRDLAVLTSRATGSALANVDLTPQLERLTKAYDSSRTMRAFSAVDGALGALERNAGPKVVADWLAVQL